VNDALEIQAPGANLLTVSGNNISGVLSTSTVPGVADVIVNDITITQGFSPSGGAIQINDETLYLRRCVVSNSTSTSGGGIAVLGKGDLTLDLSQVTGNLATNSSGGGVAILQDGSFLFV